MININSKSIDNKEILLKISITLLCLMIFSWNNTDLIEPPKILRYLAFSFFLIILLSSKHYIAFNFTFFYLLRVYNVSPFSYLPITFELYLIVFLVLTIYYRFNAPKNNSLAILHIYIFYILLITLLNLQTIFNQETYVFIFFILLIHSSYNSHIAIEKFGWAFIFLSFTFSVYFYIFKDQFSSAYFAGGQELSRSGWIDPNYFSAMLGVGCIISFFKFFEAKKSSKIKKFFLGTTIITFITVNLAASRGEILAMNISLIWVIFGNREPLIKKYIYLIMLIIFIYICYDLGLFDLLIARIIEDDGSGSGRTLIWASKLSAFAEKNPLIILFGGGSGSFWGLGMKSADAHNQFLIFLFDYGIIGLLGFIYILITPVFKSHFNVEIVALTLFCIISFMSLSPFSSTMCPCMFTLAYVYSKSLYINTSYS